MAKKHPLIHRPEDISRHAPLRLKVAAALLSPDGSMTGETLLRYVRDGRLTAEKIGGKFYTTLFQVQNMKHMIVEEKQANTIDDKTNENNRIEKFKRLREIANKRMIYIVRAGGSVKIGYSSRWQKRLKEIQVCCPDTVELLAVFRGSSADEARIHKRFSNSHIRGEWFRYESELAGWIEGGCSIS